MLSVYKSEVERSQVCIAKTRVEQNGRKGLVFAQASNVSRSFHFTSSTLFFSGQEPIVIQNVLVAIQHPVNLRQILASTVCGPITKTVRIHQTAILTMNLIHLRYRICTLQTKWPTLSCPSNEGFKFWEHEWEKHGTCSESVMDQHKYFENTLALRDRVNLLQILTGAGIEPNDEFYKLKDIKKAIKEATGFTPVINCNKDPEKNSQLHEIFFCVDTSGTEFIECPIIPRDRCPSHLQFAKF